ncbi:MAG TPA: DUF4416 family protein [Chitinispirillaceae bacterium]|nr:DUF4416 family protein [Chitinispirillaceae bacterium]
MAEIKPPLPVKYFVAALYQREEFFNNARLLMEQDWGGIDYEGEAHLFDVTAYYEPEMGSPIFRKIISFEKLQLPTFLVEMKIRCNQLEQQLSISEKRTVNLDAGYLDHNKVVLASAKEAGQKIYLDKGIYADLAGRYKSGKYQPFEWSFPDFRDGRYDQELLAIRKKCMAQVRAFLK